MVKYNHEFKLMIVQEYLDGPLGYQLLAKKYDVPDKSQVRRWVKAYNSFGKEGLRKKNSGKVYTVQFKLDVLNFRKQTGASYQDTAIKFNMNNPSLIGQWSKIFVEGGIEGLQGKRKGWPPMPKKVNSKQSKQSKSMPREELLERENELLRLEIAYLKKLNAFQENPNAFLEKHKQRWHSNSRKKDSN